MGVPFYSVVITTYNSAKTIKNTLQSVFNQTFKDYELIIIDDASNDNTLEIINNMVEKNSIQANIYTMSENKGVSFSRNEGINKSNGKYVAFLDADDIWMPNKLEIEASFLEKEHIDWVCSNYNVIDETYKYINKRIRRPGLYTYKNIVKDGNPIGMLTVAISREILLNNKFKNIHHEDFDLWIRLSKKGYICFTINNILASYMKRKSSLSGNKIKSILWTYKVFRSNNINLFFSCYLIARYLLNVVKRKKK